MVTLPFDVNAVLTALDGVAYVTDPAGTIVAVGAKHWDEFAEANDAPPLKADQVLGRSLFSFVAGAEVSTLARSVHEAVVGGMVEYFPIACRCDAPTVRREMRLIVSSIVDDGRIVGALYQSQVLAESQRPAIELFKRLLGQKPAKGPGDRAILRLCSYCHAVAWPPTTDRTDSEWIQPEEYYRRGGQTGVEVSHGICPDCFRSITARLP
jgi:hypothetical protein